MHTSTSSKLTNQRRTIVLATIIPFSIEAIIYKYSSKKSTADSLLTGRVNEIQVFFLLLVNVRRFKQSRVWRTSSKKKRVSSSARGL